MDFMCILEFNHSKLDSGSFVGKFVSRAIVFLENMKIYHLWNKIELTNSIISSFVTNRAVVISRSHLLYYMP